MTRPKEPYHPLGKLQLFNMKIEVGQLVEWLKYESLVRKGVIDTAKHIVYNKIKKKIEWFTSKEYLLVIYKEGDINIFFIFLLKG